MMGGVASAPMMDYGDETQMKTLSNTELTDETTINTVDRKITKNGDLQLLVQSAETTAQDITKKTNELGGFVQNSNIREVKDGVKSGTITIKVPADKFEQAITDFKTYGIKVERETVNSQDVTEQYVDLEAQLKNYQAEEQRYLEVMTRAYTVEDILKVSQYLARVRGQIERLQGQIKYLDRQIEMSQITVYLTAEAEIEVFGLRWRPLYEIQKSFRNMLSGLQVYANAVINFVLFLPLLLVWIISLGIIIWIIVKIIKWLVKKTHRKKNINPPIQ